MAVNFSRTCFLAAAVALASCNAAQKELAQTDFSTEPHRPQIHFSPKSGWMNDPNGLVYSNGVYHLFYQYYPDSTVWGPMHWGHATTRDLVHWQYQPIALYPDSLGYIFSGSAVADVHNTSGFGKDGTGPLVAIFTQHDPVGEKENKTDYQNQSIAYSLDEGKTWTKYSGNPVLKNPGIKDFRDPKVSWYEEGKKWIMTLATQDRITFFSSPDLKNWTKESEFGATVGAHGGVWECPDLFPLQYNGENIWVLLVSINPGGPNAGSATQYFTGRFDGRSFTPFDTTTRWIDYGPDDYAGVTWSNTGDRRIFLGWMSNWFYGQAVPTKNWRSAMTVPRDLRLEKVGDQYFVASQPVNELQAITGAPVSIGDSLKAPLTGPAKLQLSEAAPESFVVTLSNESGQKVLIGYDQASNQFYIDRTASGNVSFEKRFSGRHTAPRLANGQNLNLTLVIDVASVELFADDGLTVMTEIFFPETNFSAIQIQLSAATRITTLQLSPMKSIYDSAGTALK